MPLALQIELLSKAEIDEIWKARGRAENFAEYLNFMNAREVGDSFRIPVEKGENNAAAAREIRRNFNEAAKERTRDGKPAPVVLRWKVDSSNLKRTVKKDGKTVDEEYTVINKLTALLVSTEDIKHRAKKKAEAAPTTGGENGVSTDQDKPAEATPVTA